MMDEDNYSRITPPNEEQVYALKKKIEIGSTSSTETNIFRITGDHLHASQIRPSFVSTQAFDNVHIQKISNPSSLSLLEIKYTNTESDSTTYLPQEASDSVQIELVKAGRDLSWAQIKNNKKSQPLDIQNANEENYDTTELSQKISEPAQIALVRVRRNPSSAKIKNNENIKWYRDSSIGVHTSKKQDIFRKRCHSRADVNQLCGKVPSSVLVASPQHPSSPSHVSQPFKSLSSLSDATGLSKTNFVERKYKIDCDIDLSSVSSSNRNDSRCVLSHLSKHAKQIPHEKDDADAEALQPPTATPYKHVFYEKVGRTKKNEHESFRHENKEPHFLSMNRVRSRDLDLMTPCNLLECFDCYTIKEAQNSKKTVLTSGLTEVLKISKVDTSLSYHCRPIHKSMSNASTKSSHRSDSVTKSRKLGHEIESDQNESIETYISTDSQNESFVTDETCRVIVEDQKETKKDIYTCEEEFPCGLSHKHIFITSYTSYTSKSSSHKQRNVIHQNDRCLEDENEADRDSKESNRGGEMLRYAGTPLSNLADEDCIKSADFGQLHSDSSLASSVSEHLAKPCLFEIHIQNEKDKKQLELEEVSISESMHKNLHSIENQPYMCYICLETHSPQRNRDNLNNNLAFDPFRLTKCNHVFCRGCITSYVCSKVHAGNVYPTCFFPVENDATNSDLEDKKYAPCGCQISRNDIQKLLEGEDSCILDKYYRLKFDKENPFSRRCPDCNTPNKFEMGLNLEGVNETRVPQNPITNCENCNQEFCYYHSKAHIGKTCAEYDLEISGEIQLNEEFMGKFAKKCPQCSVWVQKLEGCNQMKCSVCGTNFCWLCLAIIDDTTFPDHFQWWNLRGCPNMQLSESVEPSKTVLILSRCMAVMQIIFLGIPSAVLSVITCPPCCCIFYLCGNSLKERSVNYFSMWGSILTGLIFICGLFLSPIIYIFYGIFLCFKCNNNEDLDHSFDIDEESSLHKS
mmetsp:Transcript_16750/g.37667  ORF Transcript_16750/g.37667 Transcript_16750/m.37667 type:complete len:971 (-) Transcript_16750:247-3159(-)